MRPTRHLLPVLALALSFASTAPARADGDHTIKGSKIGINDLPAPPRPPQGAGYNTLSMDDTAGKERVPARRPGSGFAPKPGGHAAQYDYPGFYAQRFDGVDRVGQNETITIGGARTESVLRRSPSLARRAK
jgi:hypothetical protein